MAVFDRAACQLVADAGAEGVLEPELAAWGGQRYRLRRQGPETRIFGVLGNPVGHSLSPVIHNAAFREQGVELKVISGDAPATVAA